MGLLLNVFTKLTTIFTFLTIALLLPGAEHIDHETHLFMELCGGRRGFSHHHMKLYCDSTYYYVGGNHVSKTVRDSGRWEILDTSLVLNSSGKITWVTDRYPRKKRRKLKLKEGYYLRKDTVVHFRNDTFRFKDDVLYLFQIEDLKTRSDSNYLLVYKTLYVVKEE